MPPKRSKIHLLAAFIFYISCCLVDSVAPSDTFLVSSLRLPQTKLKPYEWRYMRVELTPWFSSLVMTLVSDADTDKESLVKHSESTLPIICFRYGSFPLPDVSDTTLKLLELTLPTNGSVGGLQNLQVVDQCFSFQKNMTVTLANNQISPGVWYLGFFNGIGPARTQSKMISRGPAYTFSVYISVEGCTISALWGPFCNQTINLLSCTESNGSISSRSLLDKTHINRYSDAYKNTLMVASSDVEQEATTNSFMQMTAMNVMICKNLDQAVCVRIGMIKVYYLDVSDLALVLRVTAMDVRLNQTSHSSTSGNSNEVLIMCYARHNAMPLSDLHDYSSDISKEPLIIPFPNFGRWFIAIHVENQTELNTALDGKNVQTSVCFNLEGQVHGCHVGKGGPNCTWESHMLQRVLKRSPMLPFESYFLPIGESFYMTPTNFPLEPLLSNFSFMGNSRFAWTYFLLDIPPGAAGSNIHIQLESDMKENYGIYARYGGFPTLGIWDYYINSSSSNNGSMFLAFNDSSEQRMEIYILYAKEGLWSIGLIHPIYDPSKYHSTMSITLDGCPKRCSNHGTCHSSVDGSGSTSYSFCSCDRDHGGFDCSLELVTHKGHMWQSVALIGSNAVALLPAFWSLRQKALAEWVLFTSSGLSSALYHACDVGTWCVLTFHVLQFMDFWLSFMAVVSTFVYMATINEKSKRAIHTTVAILTALLAVSGATRSLNIILIILIGILALLIGWLLEFSTSSQCRHCISGFQVQLNILERWLAIKNWLWNLMKKLRIRFRWGFIILGFIALAAAGICWDLETSQSYWIWHSLWHVSIYTTSFLFLCSTSVSYHDQGSPNGEYELTRQSSLSRNEAGNAGMNSANGTR